jgi:SAM-dependent methyltransferase
MDQHGDLSVNTKAHWEKFFAKHQSNEVSWYQPRLDLSLRLFDRAGVSAQSTVVDIGGGDSTLVDDLLARGVEDVTVLDISAEALSRARTRLGASAITIKWIEGDVTEVQLPPDSYDFWHDRAVFFIFSQNRETGTHTVGCLILHYVHPPMSFSRHLRQMSRCNAVAYQRCASVQRRSKRNWDFITN